MTINIDPVLIAIGSLQIGWYGLMIALGVLSPSQSLSSQVGFGRDWYTRRATGG